MPGETGRPLLVGHEAAPSQSILSIQAWPVSFNIWQHLRGDGTGQARGDRASAAGGARSGVRRHAAQLQAVRAQLRACKSHVPDVNKPGHFNEALSGGVGDMRESWPSSMTTCSSHANQQSSLPSRGPASCRIQIHAPGGSMLRLASSK